MTTNNEIQLDFGRKKRLGFDEAIFCLQKSSSQIDEILQLASEKNSPMLLTRLQLDTWSELESRWAGKVDYDKVSMTGFFNFSPTPMLHTDVAIVTAGTSDAPIAREASRTLQYYGVGTLDIYDVGVAGLWRLLDRVNDIGKHPVVIAVAGMDAALPSVLGGLVNGLLIAVPTSTGYGVADNGRAALNSALVSCAPGVVVCNIDNGYGAACAALRAVKAFSR
jgi:pyridinium-3,5-biscarboxylic acid mononucleotide synthase